MAGRFPLYTDADIHGPVVKALVSADWDVVRAHSVSIAVVYREVLSHAPAAPAAGTKRRGE